MKYLIVGLGNIGDTYINTRHNVGFKVLDAFAEASNISFQDKRYGFIAEFKYKSRIWKLLKPSTFVNRSGRAVNYWLRREKISIENMLVVTDDIALPFGTLRVRPKGGDGGHNGLAHIIQILGHHQFARLRFGIGNDYSMGNQVDYVLDQWSSEEEKVLGEKINTCIEIIKSFGITGLERTMNQYNSL